MKYNVFLSDLSSRQNRCVTIAQLHSYKNVRKYSDSEIRDAIKEFGGCSKYMSEQIDLEGAEVNKMEKQRDAKYKELEDELEKKYQEIENVREYFSKKLEEQKPENFFVYEKKLILIEDSKNLVLKHKSDLFEELIEEFKKLYNWLDNRGAYLKFEVEEDNIVIDKTEIKMVIKFFEKLNRIKSDAA